MKIINADKYKATLELTPSELETLKIATMNEYYRRRDMVGEASRKHDFEDLYEALVEVLYETRKGEDKQ